MVLERPGAKQPAASRPTAARRPQRCRSCLGSRFEIFSMKPAHLNNGWRTTAADVPAASGAHSTPTPTPSPLTKPPLSRQASNAAAAQTDRVGAGLASWTMRAASWARCCRSASSRMRVGSGSSAGGVPRGQQVYRGWRTLVGVLEGLHGVCCHIISLHNINHSQTRLGRGFWGSTTLKPLQPRKNG